MKPVATLTTSAAPASGARIMRSPLTRLKMEQHPCRHNSNFCAKGSPALRLCGLVVRNGSLRELVIQHCRTGQHDDGFFAIFAGECRPACPVHSLAPI